MTALTRTIIPISKRNKKKGKRQATYARTCRECPEAIAHVFVHTPPRGRAQPSWAHRPAKARLTRDRSERVRAVNACAQPTLTSTTHTQKRRGNNRANAGAAFTIKSFLASRLQQQRSLGQKHRYFSLPPVQAALF